MTVLLWTTGAWIVASILARTFAGSGPTSRGRRRDLRDLERGRYSPSPEMAFQIARVFRAPLDEVFQYPDGAQ